MLNLFYFNQILFFHFKNDELKFNLFVLERVYFKRFNLIFIHVLDFLKQELKQKKAFLWLN